MNCPGAAVATQIKGFTTLEHCRDRQGKNVENKTTFFMFK